MLWTDNMVIPVGAPNTAAALEYMNYVYEPDVQAPITNYIQYVTPVDGVQEIFEKEGNKAGREPADLPRRASSRRSARRRSTHRSRAPRRSPRSSRTSSRGEARMTLRRRLIPAGLLAPGVIWLVLFFVVPMYFMAEMSLRSGSLASGGFAFTWEWSNFPDVLEGRGDQILRTVWYSGIATAALPADRLPARLRDRLQGQPPVAPADAVRGDRAVLHHLPDPHDRLEDDPRRPEPGRQRAPDDPPRARRTAACWRLPRP